MQRIFVTGANTGIGLALCKQLVSEHACHVYLGARNAEKGAAAVDEVKKVAKDGGNVEFVLIDVASADSIKTAAATVTEKLKGEALYALVNNAGAGLAHNITAESIIKTNLFGPKMVTDAFLPLLQPKGGRIVNVGSGAGPMYVAKQPEAVQKKLIDPAITWEEIEQLSKDVASCGMGGYGLSKALLAAYTQLLAREHPDLLCSCLSPGFIQTNMTAGFGAKLTPEQGTVSLRHCLFADLEPTQSGWFWGSDAKRSPLHVGRDPGTPEYDGTLPF